LPVMALRTIKRPGAPRLIGGHAISEPAEDPQGGSGLH